MSLERVITYLLLGKHPLARVNAHPSIFAAELQAPMCACQGEYGRWTHSTMDCLEVHKLMGGSICLYGSVKHKCSLLDSTISEG